MSVELGKRYCDAVTGFEAVAVAVTEYLQGCRRVTLEKLNENGDGVITLTFDEPNLAYVDEGALKRVPRRTVTGGPHDHNSIVDNH